MRSKGECGSIGESQSLAKRSRFLIEVVFYGWLLVLTTGYVIRNLGCAPDDSYITFQYAANAAEGHGLVFNIGERHYGSTAMGQAVLLAGLGRGVSALVGFTPFTEFAATPREIIPTAAVALSAVSLASIALIWFWIGRRSRFPTVCALLSIVLAGYLFSGLPSNFVAGHETCLFVALLFAGAYLALFKNSLGKGGVGIAAATLIRPDGALFACLFFALIAASSNLRGNSTTAFKAALRFGVSYLVVVVPWVSFLWITFGSPIPDTMTAKKAQVVLGHWPLFTVEKALRTLGEHLPVSLWVLFAAAALVGVTRVRALGRARLVRGPSDPLIAYTILWIAFGAGLIAAYASFGVTFWRWYVYPTHYAALALSIPAVCAIGSAVERRVFVAVLPATVLAAFLVFDAAPMLKTLREWATLEHENEHTAINQQLAAFLKEVAPDGATIATSEPGNLAYRLGSRFRVVDTLGLTSPGVSRAILDGNRNYAFEAWKPDFVVSSWRVATIPVSLPWFSARYELVGDFRSAYWARYLNRGVYLYELRERDPEKRTPVGERVSASLPPEVASELSNGATRCKVERIQDTRVRAREVNKISAGDLLRLNGWSIDAAHGKSPRRVFIRLQRDVTTYFVEAPIRIRRDDLADFFGDPSFAKSGWQASIDVSNVDPGEYSVDIVLVSEDTMLCVTGQRVEILQEMASVSTASP